MSDKTTITIVCKAKRVGGTKIDLYGKNYHFKTQDASNPDALHVCDIPTDDARQIHRLLSIKDGYALLDPSAELPARPSADRGQTIANDGNVGGAPESKPVIIKDGDGVEINLTAMSFEDLKIFARDNFGIAGHHKWKSDTWIAKIVEATRAEGENE